MNKQNYSQIEVGDIVSVSGNTITVQLLSTVKSNMPIVDGVVYRIGQIGSFLKVCLGYSNLYGVVTQIGASAAPSDLEGSMHSIDYTNIDNHQWLNMVLIGEQIGNKFERGVSQFPTTGDKVYMVTIDDLNIVYGGYNKEDSITVGNISASESLSAKLDINKLITRHFAVLGSTGSGKSNAVGVLLNKITRERYPSSRVLVIDPHGEYKDGINIDSDVYRIKSDEGEKELFIPFWALPFNELMATFAGNLNDQNTEYLRSKILSAKLKTVDAGLVKIEKELVTADSPIPFNIKQLWFELDDFERQTFVKAREIDTKTALVTEGNAEKLISNEYLPSSPGGGTPFLNWQAKGILGFLDAMKLKLADSTYGFLFSPGDYSPDVNGKTEKGLDDLLLDWLGNKSGLTILDLSGIPSEIMTSISGTLLKIVYDALFWGQNLEIGGKQQPLLIILEEAHNYLRAGEDSISSRAVQRIAKEGRKYGVGLGLVTQRPAELDSTVLSQCGTIIALRMNNSSDRSHVKAAIQDELQTMVDLLSSLRTGEAIISGEAVKIPSRMCFYKLPNAIKGSDPHVAELWTSPREINKEKYNELVFLWQNHKLKIKERPNE